MIELRPYQAQAADEIRAAFIRGVQSVLFTLSTGGGKCLGRGTPVLMYDGTIKPVESIDIGDRLMGPDSKPRRVLSLARGREQLYRVVPVKGDPYVVNESHILSLKRTCESQRPQHPCQKRTGEVVNLSVRDYLARSKHWRHLHKGWRAAVDFPAQNEELPIPAWILGAWLGDGMTGKLVFTTAENEIYREIRTYAKRIGMKVNVKQNSCWSVNLHLAGKHGKLGRAGSKFGNALRDLGIFHCKRIPHCYKTASRNERLELLAGIIDTDGHNSGKGFDLTLKSEQLMDDVVFVARSLGFACYKRAVKKTCCNNGATGTYFSCHINGNIETIPCRLPRKQAAPRRQKKNPLVTGIRVEPIGEDEYFGFEIDGDRLFMLGDFTVTHNTILFSFIARNAAARGNGVLILAHRDALIKQASRKLSENGVDHGIIMAGYTPKPYCNVQVASVQTMVRRVRKQKYDFRLIVVDEAHLSAAKSYHEILASMPDARILGVTGTPSRLDGKGLGRHAGGHFDELIVGTSIADLISMRWLVRPVVYAPDTQPDLSSVKKSGADHNEEQLAAVMDRPVITGCAVEHYQRICNGVPAVAWCVNLKHAENVAAQFTAAGIPAVALKGDHTGDERDKVMAKLASGEIKVVTFCQLLVEGVDCPAIGCVILLRPTYSLTSYLQVIGRGLRPDPDNPAKDRCFVLDHAGLTWRHGLADEVREWSLDGVQKRKKKKKDEEKGPKVDIAQCQNCFLVFNAAPVCPGCGQEMPKHERKITQVEGVLQEVTPEMVAARRHNRNREIHAAKTLEELEALGKKYGHKEGWAYVRWRVMERKRAERKEKRNEEREAIMRTYENDPAFLRLM